VQVIWLVALVPAVWVGAGSWGLAGAAAAQVAVAAVIVAPIYLYELNRASLAPVEVLRRLLLPALAALAVFGVAFLADSVLRPDLVVLLVGGVVALAAIGLLGYRLRGDFRALRQA
jgi:PST family polysaccharide transporter